MAASPARLRATETITRGRCTCEPTWAAAPGWRRIVPPRPPGVRLEPGTERQMPGAGAAPIEVAGRQHVAATPHLRRVQHGAEIEAPHAGRDRVGDRPVECEVEVGERAQILVQADIGRVGGVPLTQDYGNPDQPAVAAPGAVEDGAAAERRLERRDEVPAERHAHAVEAPVVVV